MDTGLLSTSCVTIIPIIAQRLAAMHFPQHLPTLTLAMTVMLRTELRQVAGLLRQIEPFSLVEDASAHVEALIADFTGIIQCWARGDTAGVQNTLEQLPAEYKELQQVLDRLMQQIHAQEADKTPQDPK